MLTLEFAGLHERDVADALDELEFTGLLEDRSPGGRRVLLSSAAGPEHV